jgi:LPXTG-motif cell wall-anchored protein
MAHVRAAAIILGLLTLLAGAGSASAATPTLSSTPSFASQPRTQGPQARHQPPPAPPAHRSASPRGNLPHTGSDLSIQLLLAGGLIGCGLILGLRRAR